VIQIKILQFNNTASVPLAIARYMRSLGHKVDVVHPIFSKLDDDHIRGVTDVIIVAGDRHSMHNWIKRYGGKYDVIHIHAIMEYIPLFKELYPNTPIIYTGHGRDVRERWDLPYLQQLLKDIKYLTVSTKDLLDGSPEHTDYIPNVADPTVWIRKQKPIKNLALYKFFGRSIVDEVRVKEEAEVYAKDRGWTLQVQNRSNAHIPNIKYPRYIEKFGIFFDFRYLNPNVYKNVYLPLSYTAIQFLTLGDNRVIHYFGEEYTEVPKEFNYSDVMKRWENIYNKVM